MDWQFGAGDESNDLIAVIRTAYRGAVSHPPPLLHHFAAYSPRQRLHALFPATLAYVCGRTRRFGCRFASFWHAKMKAMAGVQVNFHNSNRVTFTRVPAWRQLVAQAAAAGANSSGGVPRPHAGRPHSGEER